MKSFFKTNRLFFLCYALFLVLGGILLFTIQKGDVILFFSENRSTFGDTFFRYFTKMGEEPAYILAIFLLLFIRIRHAFLIPILGLVVTIVSYVLKSGFATYRPATFFKNLKNFDQVNLVEGIVLHTGANSFPSGHTMSAFALFALVAFLVPNKKWAAFLLLLFAILVGISRVYIVQHFWQDIYAGSFVGVTLGVLFWWVQNRFPVHPSKWWHRGLLEKEKTQHRA